MNEILRKQFLRHVAQTSPAPQLIEVARAEGVFFYTPEGKPYYDLVSGVSVNNVGHGNKAVIEAVQRQAADYMHIMVYGEMVERPQVEFARLLAETLPAPLDTVYFLNSGKVSLKPSAKSYEIIVVKGGNTDDKPLVTVTVDERIIEDYNSDNGSIYDLMPESVYAISSVTETIDNTTKIVSYPITLDLTNLSTGSWMLPLRLTSSTTKVNENKDKLMLVIEIK